MTGAADGGLPAGFDWSPLVPELIVSNLDASLAFWCGLIGFSIAYDRPEERFAFLDLNGAQIMLEERDEAARQWVVAPLEAPLGRGINFQINVQDCDLVRERLERAGTPLLMDIEEKWYRAGNAELGVRQFLVQEPDGYLLRLSTSLGTRSIVGGSLS